MYNSFDSNCFIHEMAHRLDVYNLHVSKQFAKYVGAYSFFGYHTGDEKPPIYGKGNPPNRYEDFAESLAEYVLLYTNYSGSDIGIRPGQKRWYFIESILDTGIEPIANGTSDCTPNRSLLAYLDY